MILSTPDVKHVVDDYDFTFISGMTMPITVNPAVGDSIQFGEPIQIHLSAKPSMTDPLVTLPAETITVYTKHLAAVIHRTREVVAPDPEQQHAWAQAMKDLTKTIQ